MDANRACYKCPNVYNNELRPAAGTTRESGKVQSFSLDSIMSTHISYPSTPALAQYNILFTILTTGTLTHHVFFRVMLRAILHVGKPKSTVCLQPRACVLHHQRSFEDARVER